jgi:hypothetical protein
MSSLPKATPLTAVDNRASIGSRDCDGCGETFSDLRRCKECAQAWYCSKKCQTDNWSHHKFTCQLHKLTTADYLARAARRDLLPQDLQTRKDYGFDRAELMVDDDTGRHAGPAPNMLFGLYVGLLNYLNISPSQLHKWRKSGVLVEQIKMAFETLPAASRGGYYAWFLENEHVLDPLAPAPSESAFMDAAWARGWRYMGGSPSASSQRIRTAIKSMPEEDLPCFHFASFLLSSSHPSPAMGQWITFGFCVCPNQYEEMQLSGAYQQLLRCCTFDELKTAYNTSTMAALFDRKKIAINFPHFRDVMRGSPRGPILTVWYLKAFVVNDEKPGTNKPIPSVNVDYGFIHCKTQAHQTALHDTYRRFFEEQGDPMKLHEACLQGSTGALYTFVTSVVPPKDSKTAKMLQEVMHNFYPLREPAD